MPAGVEPSTAPALVTEASVPRRMALCALWGPSSARTMVSSDAVEGALEALDFWGRRGPSSPQVYALWAQGPSIPPCGTSCPALLLEMYPRKVGGTATTGWL